MPRPKRMKVRGAECVGEGPLRFRNQGQMRVIDHRAVGHRARFAFTIDKRFVTAFALHRRLRMASPPQARASIAACERLGATNRHTIARDD